MRDPYQILEINSNATIDEIKKAYRILAMKYHPDRNLGDPTSDIKFREITEAFNQLKDLPPVTATFEKSNPNPTKSKTYRSTTSEINSIICQFFDGDKNFGRSILLHVNLTKSEFKNGCKKPIKWKKRCKCELCEGYGVANLKDSVILKCAYCNGTGNVMQIGGKLGLHYPKCQHCDGAGFSDMYCKSCKGEGLLDDYMVEEIVIDVSPNTISGTQIVLRGRGENGKKGMPCGNLHVIFIEEG